jgi:hypothetical protein
MLCTNAKGTGYSCQMKTNLPQGTSHVERRL